MVNRIFSFFDYSIDNPILFGQYQFLAFFSILMVGYAFVYKKISAKIIYLLLFSLFFYYKASGWYFLLLLFSSVVDFGFGWGVYLSKKIWEKRLYLVLSLVVNLSLLAYFKYSYYLVDQINVLFDVQWKAVNVLNVFSNSFTGSNLDIFDIFLPVGISFYTFQTMSYTIDVYRGNLKPSDSFTDFAFFVSFFPQLVAGPIVRAADFLPQIRKSYFLTKTTFGIALFLILGGYIKKAFISDYISINFVDRVFDNPELYSGFLNLMAVYGYSIQIYCDFSGYSDMAIGLAALLGFTLPLNFNSPYKSVNITDFWRRWHISLSSWLKDYLYISLGGNRRAKWRTYFNLLVTMLLGGLWHGAATKFIVWGGLHGLALGLHKVWKEYFRLPSYAWINTISIIFTFHFVAFCWMYFRAADMNTVSVMLNNIFTNFDWVGIAPRVGAYWKVILAIFIGFFLHFIPQSFKDYLRDKFVGTTIFIKAAIAFLVIFCSYQIASSELQPFIYFQF